MRVSAPFSTTSCGREELNECLADRYVLVYDEVEFAKFGEALLVVWRGSFEQNCCIIGVVTVTIQLTYYG